MEKWFGVGRAGLRFLCFRGLRLKVWVDPYDRCAAQKISGSLRASFTEKPLKWFAVLPTLHWVFADEGVWWYQSRPKPYFFKAQD